MEAGNDTFGAGVEAAADDPFAGAEAEFDQAGQDPLAEEVPTVDREGNPVAATQAAPSSEEAMLAEADRLRHDQAAAEANDPDPEPQGEQVAMDPSQNGQQETVAPDPTGAAASAAVPDPPGTTSGAAGSTSTAPDSTPEPASSAEPGVADGSRPVPVDVAVTPVPEDAEPPAERKGKDGQVTHRRYAILRPEGDGVWREVHWHEKDGKIVKASTPGAKKQKVCLARGQEDALAVGFAAMGAPSGGCKLIAVSLTYFQLRDVAPDPVQPIRQRLKIK